MAFTGYRTLARFAEVLPARGVAPVAGLAARIGMRVLPARAALVRSHLRRVTGVDPAPALVRAAFASYARYWLDAFRLPVEPEERLAARVRTEGLEHVDEALAAGKGVVFALPHVGNWDVAGAWLTRVRGLSLTVVAEAVEPPELRVWFHDFRKALGMDVVFNGPRVVGEITAALGRNGAVALLCDRDVDGSGLSVPFFGEPAPLPKGPATLAFRTGAALLPVAVFQEPDGHRIVVSPPVELQRAGRLRDDVASVTADLATRLEPLIRRAPQQWHLFQPNWPSDHVR